MSEPAKDNEDTSLDRLFAKARKYQLLAAGDEQASEND